MEQKDSEQEKNNSGLEENVKIEKHLKEFSEEEKQMIKLMADIFVKYLVNNKSIAQ